MESVDQCVTKALKLADLPDPENEELHSILFPLLGIGTRLKSPRDTVQSLFAAAIGYLRDYPLSRVEDVYFLAWSEAELDLCRSILSGDDRVTEIQS